MNLEHPAIRVVQAVEIAEWIGFETRNKYRITDEAGNPLGFAAEQQKGILGFLFRQFLGHWRPFSIHFFDNARKLIWIGQHPFRIFFQRLELFEAEGSRRIGAIQRRFSILTKRFDVEDANGNVLMEVASPIWRIWTFQFIRPKDGQEVAKLEKKWSGILTEAFTDKDRFRVEFKSTSVSADERTLLMAAAVFVDLMYFETKGSGISLSDFGN
ncbi:MAG: hypothetical protein JNL01_02970 [Bdellovibrionales bacterium]|nr:hypothetical protein [Bdellovibrionales bacterium]